MIKKSRIYRFTNQVDTQLYRLLKQLNSLSKKQQRIILCIALLCLFTFINLINGMVDNNAAWLKGSWSNKSAIFTFKEKNELYRTWDIKKNNHILLENTQVDVNSTKQNIVLKTNRSLTEYHMTKLGKRQLELRIFNNGKQVRRIKLNKNY